MYVCVQSQHSLRCIDFLNTFQQMNAASNEFYTLLSSDKTNLPCKSFIEIVKQS